MFVLYSPIPKMPVGIEVLEILKGTLLHITSGKTREKRITKLQKIKMEMREKWNICLF